MRAFQNIEITITTENMGLIICTTFRFITYCLRNYQTAVGPLCFNGFDWCALRVFLCVFCIFYLCFYCVSLYNCVYFHLCLFNLAVKQQYSAPTNSFFTTYGALLSFICDCDCVIPNKQFYVSSGHGPRQPRGSIISPRYFSLRYCVIKFTVHSVTVGGRW